MSSFAGADSCKAWSIRQAPVLFVAVALQQTISGVYKSDQGSWVLRSFTLLSIIAVTYVSYTVFWRLYLSPISHFPGPKFAAMTWLYEMYYDIYKDGQFHFQLQKLHERYGIDAQHSVATICSSLTSFSGPIIRVNPRELHISDPSYYDMLYTHKGRWDKSPLWCAQFGSSEAEVLTISHDLHRTRRSVLAPFFSKQKVLAMESVIQEQIEKFCDRIEREFKGKGMEADKQLPIRLATNCLTLAIVCEYCFGRAYGTLDFEGLLLRVRLRYCSLTRYRLGT